ncbi:MAG: hypothetical protein Q4A04_09840 [Eubacteriales bacterium]|nr:hypothetical protein [Eubacteriales bacterium]
MKTKEELDALKEEVEAVNEKLQELTPEEIAQVSGGMGFIYEQPVPEPPVFETAREDYVSE